MRRRCAVLVIANSRSQPWKDFRRIHGLPPLALQGFQIRQALARLGRGQQLLGGGGGHMPRHIAALTAVGRLERPLLNGPVQMSQLEGFTARIVCGRDFRRRTRDWCSTGLSGFRAVEVARVKIVRFLFRFRYAATAGDSPEATPARPVQKRPGSPVRVSAWWRRRWTGL